MAAAIAPTARLFLRASHAPDDDRLNVRTEVLSKIPFNGRADAAFPCSSVSYLSRITMMNFALIGAAAVAAQQLWQFLLCRISTRNQIVKNLAAGNPYADGGYYRDNN